MAKQRNEPNDPAAELADYDFSKSEGSSPADTGKIETNDWPDGVDRERFTDKGKKIVPKWVRSHYEKPTTEAVSQFADTIDSASKETVRINVIKAQQHKIRQSDIRPSERLAIYVLAYEGVKDYKDLSKQYPISAQVFKNTAYAYDKIIDAQNPTMSEVKNEVERYKNNTYGSKSKTKSDKNQYEQARPELIEFFESNPTADAQDAIDAVDYNPNWQSVNSLRSNLIKHGRINPDADSEGSQDKTDPDTTGFAITLELTKEQAREVVLTQELNDGIQQKVVTAILDDVGL